MDGWGSEVCERERERVCVCVCVCVCTAESICRPISFLFSFQGGELRKEFNICGGAVSDITPIARPGVAGEVRCVGGGGCRGPATFAATSCGVACGCRVFAGRLAGS